MEDLNIKWFAAINEGDNGLSMHGFMVYAANQRTPIKTAKDSFLLSLLVLTN